MRPYSTLVILLTMINPSTYAEETRFLVTVDEIKNGTISITRQRDKVHADDSCTPQTCIR